MRARFPLRQVPPAVTLAAIVLTIAADGRTFGQAAGPTGARFGKNLRLTPGLQQNETAIAANPLNPDNLVAVSQGPQAFGQRACRFMSTMDGGRSWTLGGSVPLERSGDECGDPSIAADARGTFYFSYLDVVVSDFIAVELDLLVAKSTDGGRTFSTFSIGVDMDPRNPKTVLPDKDYVAVDAGAASPFQGTIYVSYVDAGYPRGDAIEVILSRDGGATWSSPLVVAGPATNEKGGITRTGALPVVAPDGTAYVFYAEFPFGVFPTSIRFVRSSDGGVSWSPPADVAAGLPSPGFFMLKNADPQFGADVAAGLTSNSLPTAAAASDGTVYVAWTDFPEGSCAPDASSNPPCTNADVRLAVSRDRGLTWSPPVKATDETNRTDQFFPWIAAHPGGLVSMVWRDKRLDPDNMMVDTFYTNTSDGAGFLPNVRVSSTSSPLPAGTFLGDYQGLAVTASGVFPVWTDTRFGVEETFTATGRLIH